MTAEDRSKEPTAEVGAGQRAVPVAWAALEDAFENNAPEVHSYLHLVTGDVIRVVDGVADPVTHARIVADSGYRRVDPVSSREQYRWMERFIATVEDGVARVKLLQSIDGKGAFRRFKDALMGFPNERERWFSFRSERLKMCMEAWLEAQGIHVVARPDWPVPGAEPATPAPLESAALSEPPLAPVSAPPPPVLRRASVPVVRDARAQLLHLASTLGTAEVDTALAFVEFLIARRAPAALDEPVRVSARPSEALPSDSPPMPSGRPSAPAPFSASVLPSEPPSLGGARRIVPARAPELREGREPVEAPRRVAAAEPEATRKPSVVGGSAGEELDPTRRSSRV